MPKKYEYPFDLSIDKIWENILDFWKDFADKDLIEQFWKGYKILFDDHVGKYSYFLTFAQSLEYVDASPILEWFIFFFEKDSDTCEINRTVYDILTLQDKYEEPTLILHKTTDFTIEEEGERKFLKLVGGVVSENTIYWAPIVEFDLREIIWKFIGCLFPLVDYNYFTPDQYKLLLQSIWWYSFKGPSLKNIERIVAALLGAKQTLYDGIVQNIVSGVTYDQITIRTQDLEDYTYSIPTGKSAVNIGDSVTRFECLQTGIVAKDFKTHPNWWSGTQYNEIQARNVLCLKVDSYLGEPCSSWMNLFNIISFLLPKRTRLLIDISLPIDAAIVWDLNQTNRVNNVCVISI